MVTETETKSELNTEEKVALAEINKVAAELADPLPEVRSVVNRDYLGLKSWYSQNRDFIILGLVAVIVVGVVVLIHAHAGK